MACRNMTVKPMDRRSDEVVPIGLRETSCAIRERNPATYVAMLRERGVDVDEESGECRHNIDGSWDQCPFYATCKP